MILDTAATKSVVGRPWMDEFYENSSDETKKAIRLRKDERNFRFGDKTLFPSREEVSVPLEMGKLKENIDVSIVEADIPLLIGIPELTELGFVIDVGNKTLTIKKTSETFNLCKTKSGHLALPLVSSSLSEEVFKMEDCSLEEKVKKVRKIHQILCHPRKEILLNFFRASSNSDDETLDIVKEVSNSCKVCLKHKRTPSDPKVGMPLACDFNQCVTLDLRGPINVQKHYILYAIDSFSRLTRGIIIKNKQPETVVKAILDVWVLGKGVGPGVPEKFYFDNGGEFCNSSVIDLAEKYGISMHGITAANSPFSNGLCERNHAVVDTMMRKIKAGDDK